MTEERIREIAQRAFNMAKNSENPEGATITLISEMLDAAINPPMTLAEQNEISREALKDTIHSFTRPKQKWTITEELEYQYDLMELLRVKELSNRPYSMYGSHTQTDSYIDGFKILEQKFIEKYSHKFI